MHINPIDLKARTYYKDIKITKKLFPNIIAVDCCKCGDKILYEQIYTARIPSTIFERCYTYHYGCTHCFVNSKEFTQFIHTNYVESPKFWKEKKDQWRKINGLPEQFPHY